MQATRVITEQNIDEVLTAVYKEGEPIAYQADSDYGEELKRFNSKEELTQEIGQLLYANAPFFQFAFYYPESEGFVEKQRAVLNLKKCNGHTFRFSLKGWGLIYLQFHRKPHGVECRAAVNTEKRANAWKDTNPDLKEPSLWQWNVVEKNARRIIRVINKIAQQGTPADPKTATRFSVG